MTATVEVLHVQRAFSAQPTLGDALGPAAVVHELPLAEALAAGLAPDLVWVSDTAPERVRVVRERFAGAGLLATASRTASAEVVLVLLECGADLVVRDEGVLLAAAALQAMARRQLIRRAQQASSVLTGSGSTVIVMPPR